MNSPAGLDVKRFFSLPEILVRKLPFPGVDHYEGGGGEGTYSNVRREILAECFCFIFRNNSAKYFIF